MGTSVVSVLQFLQNSMTVQAILLNILAYFVGTAFTYFIISPLRYVPGPIHRRMSFLPLLYSTYTGRETAPISALHQKHGPIVLVAPHWVSIAAEDLEGNALSTIYSKNGGFLKPVYYRNFDIGGHETLFSTRDPMYRAQRAKAVASLFAITRVREAETIFASHGKSAACYLNLTREERDGKIDLFDLGRRFALDSLTEYLFDKNFGSLQHVPKRGSNTLDQKECVNALRTCLDQFQDVMKLWLLPKPIYNTVMSLKSYLSPQKDAESSNNQMEAWTRSCLPSLDRRQKDHREKGASNYSYQARLLTDAKISEDESVAQMIDVIFAGAEVTGYIFALTIWHLVRHRDVYEVLRQEVSSKDKQAKNRELNTGDNYLSAVITEVLRLARANPTILPRVVPKGGFTYTTNVENNSFPKTYFLPEGTVVGTSSSFLHFDESIYTEPYAFKPERWLDRNDKNTKEKRPNDERARMNHNFFAFGMGPRQCIGRNLAMEELKVGIREIVSSGSLNDTLDGKRARTVGEKVEIGERFNSCVISEDGQMQIHWQ